MDGFSLTLRGFKTKQQVQEFLNWYEGQGEQDSCIWFECRDNMDGVTTMNVDVRKEYEWDGNNLIAYLQMLK